MSPEEANRLIEQMLGRSDELDDVDLAARAISDEWNRCLAHLPRDVFEALSDHVMMRSEPDPNADDGVHASFLFDDGKTLVSYRDGATCVATRQDGSVELRVFREGSELERRHVPPAAFEQHPWLN